MEIGWLSSKFTANRPAPTSMLLVFGRFLVGLFIYKQLVCLLTAVLFFGTGCQASEPTASEQHTNATPAMFATEDQPSDSLANEDSTNDNASNNNAKNDDLTNNDLTNDDLTNDDLTNDYVTNDDLTVSVPETAVITIPLSGDADDRNAEISGMAWYGDWLILLPQYPTFNRGEGDGHVFALPRADILAFLDGQKESPLTPVEIPLIAPGLSRAVAGYEGFEGIAFDGERAFLTVEASPATGMTGRLVVAEMAADLSALVIDMGRITAVESASGLPNKSDEALILAGEQVVTIHEVNGAELVDAPVAQRFNYELQADGVVSFPAIEYRITDVTAIDGDGRFWAINYYFPGEAEMRPRHDPIAEEYGQGATHAQRDGVERLLELQLTESGLSLIDQPPIQLELLPNELRNWEGIARLEDRGFLLVTDKFPETILGFVPHS